ncbi:hypothetical protein F511_11676 [Dorcoceras hygrometricum]|uniref:Splicing factor 3B subunit 1-like n=1 Tax=Dorcoceras hygrometricum TaxID=472368 RepID=A0A2Z7B3I3_9LAMI|nr:hypothetical protein F511_11676 [Dorcoceras hygrometricum]
MASSLIANSLQVNFDSVLGIPDNDGMVKMFIALESTGLRGFLGCLSVFYRKELEQFFDTALVKDNEVLYVIHGKMADRSSKRTKGYAAQICVMLKEDPYVTLEEAKTFPPLKIVSAKIVSTYVATNKTIDARGESDEPDVPKLAKRKEPKRKLRLSTGSDDEIVEKEPDLEHVEETKKEQTIVDDVDKIIVQVLTETAQMETNVVEPDIAKGVEMGTDLTELEVTRSDDIVVKISECSFAINDEDDDISRVEQTSKITDMEEGSVKNKETDIQLVETATGKEIDPEPVEDVG